MHKLISNSLQINHNYFFLSGQTKYSTQNARLPAHAQARDKCGCGDNVTKQQNKCSSREGASCAIAGRVKGRHRMKFTVAARVWHLGSSVRRCASVASSAPVNSEPRHHRAQPVPARCATEFVPPVRCGAAKKRQSMQRRHNNSG